MGDDKAFPAVSDVVLANTCAPDLVHCVLRADPLGLGTSLVASW